MTDILKKERACLKSRISEHERKKKPVCVLSNCNSQRTIEPINFNSSLDVPFDDENSEANSEEKKDEQEYEEESKSDKESEISDSDDDVIPILSIQTNGSQNPFTKLSGSKQPKVKNPKKLAPIKTPQKRKFSLIRLPEVEPEEVSSVIVQKESTTQNLKEIFLESFENLKIRSRSSSQEEDKLDCEERELWEKRLSAIKAATLKTTPYLLASSVKVLFENDILTGEFLHSLFAPASNPNTSNIEAIYMFFGFVLTHRPDFLFGSVYQENDSYKMIL